MRNRVVRSLIAATLMSMTALGPSVLGQNRNGSHGPDEVQVGPRPFYLVEGMDAGPLNASCSVPWTGPGQKPEPKCCTIDAFKDAGVDPKTEGKWPLGALRTKRRGRLDTTPPLNAEGDTRR
jgi:hypothetical protein